MLRVENLDLDGAHVFLATSLFNLNYPKERSPDIRFDDVKTTTA